MGNIGSISSVGEIQSSEIRQIEFFSGDNIYVTKGLQVENGIFNSVYRSIAKYDDYDRLILPAYVTPNVESGVPIMVNNGKLWRVRLVNNLPLLEKIDIATGSIDALQMTEMGRSYQPWLPTKISIFTPYDYSDVIYMGEFKATDNSVSLVYRPDYSNDTYFYGQKTTPRAIPNSGNDTYKLMFDSATKRCWTIINNKLYEYNHNSESFLQFSLPSGVTLQSACVYNGVLYGKASNGFIVKLKIGVELSYSEVGYVGPIESTMSISCCDGVVVGTWTGSWQNAKTFYYDIANDEFYSDVDEFDNNPLTLYATVSADYACAYGVSNNGVSIVMQGYTDNQYVALKYNGDYEMMVGKYVK